MCSSREQKTCEWIFSQDIGILWWQASSFCPKALEVFAPRHCPKTLEYYGGGPAVAGNGVSWCKVSGPMSGSSIGVSNGGPAGRIGRTTRVEVVEIICNQPHIRLLNLCLKKRRKKERKSERTRTERSQLCGQDSYFPGGPMGKGGVTNVPGQKQHSRAIWKCQSIMGQGGLDWVYSWLLSVAGAQETGWSCPQEGGIWQELDRRARAPLSWTKVGTQMLSWRNQSEQEAPLDGSSGSIWREGNEYSLHSS